MCIQINYGGSGSARITCISEDPDPLHETDPNNGIGQQIQGLLFYETDPDPEQNETDPDPEQNETDPDPEQNETDPDPEQNETDQDPEQNEMDPLHSNFTINIVCTILSE